MAANTEIKSAMLALPANSIVFFVKPSGKKVLAITDNVINMTGSKAIKKLGNVDGSDSAGLGLPNRKVSDAVVPIFFMNLPKTGPAMIEVGMASSRPYTNVLPISA